MQARRHFTIVGILLVTTLVFVCQQFFDDALVMRFGAIPSQITGAWRSLVGGEFSLSAAQTLTQLFSSVLLHGGAEHIVYNMVFLWTFGSLASEHLGAWWALAVFVVTGVCGSIAQVLLNPESPIPFLGASGAVCGYEGLYLGMALRWRLDWPDVWPLAHPIPPLQLAAFAVLGFFYDAYSLMTHDQGIAYGAHIGGLVAGLTIAILLTMVYPTDTAFARSGLGRRRRLL